MEKWFKNIFSTNEVRFIGFFAMVFLGSALLLAVTGFLPSELRQSSEGGIVDTLFNNPAPRTEPLQGDRPGHSALSILNSTNPSAQQGGGNGASGGTSGSAGASGAGTSGPGIGDGKIIVPDRLIVPSLDINTIVKNPSSTSITVLDSELKKGAVRYPGSGSIGKGNMFIFGHSTGFRVVQNQAYRVFNELHKVRPGDEILLQSGSTTFVYKVKSVNKVDKNEALVKFDTTRNMLTISTCDSFGAKDDRYVVEADYVGTRG
jgi:LPXTG-site transpeptidase (sortase) family protein